MTADARPVVALEASPIERVLDCIAVAALLFAAIDLAVQWPRLPDRVPSHFNLRGDVDGYGGKWTLILLPGISAAIVVGFTLLRRIPQCFNFPIQVTAENAPRLYRAGRDLLTWLRTEIAVGFAAIGHEIANVSLGGTTATIAWLVPVFVAGVFCTIGWSLVQMVRRR